MYYLILENGDYASGLAKPAKSVEVPKRPHYLAVWSEGVWSVSADVSMSEMREQRNILLSATDWQASSDLTMTAEQTAYRQALRDLPSTATPALDEDGQLTGVTWPEKPE